MLNSMILNQRNADALLVKWPNTVPAGSHIAGASEPL